MTDLLVLLARRGVKSLPTFVIASLLLVGCSSVRHITYVAADVANLPEAQHATIRWDVPRVTEY